LESELDTELDDQSGQAPDAKSSGDRGPARKSIVPTLDVSLVIPVGTGDARIGEVWKALGTELDRLGKSWELIAVFDGCRGPAWKAASELADQYPDKVTVIAFQQTFGASACLSAALDHSRGRVLVTSPEYVQVDPVELGALLQVIENGADFAAPWRHPRVDALLNRVQSAAFNSVMRRIIKTSFHDLNCYFRAIRREVLEEMALYGDMYRFLPVIAHRQGFNVKEVKVRHLQEWGGVGIFGIGVYMRRFLDIIGVVFLTHFTAKPLRFFGSLGAIFAGSGGLLTLVLFFQWLFTDDHALYSRPIFHVGILFFVLGIQVIGFGLVGEIIIYTQARKMREYRIERIYDK
jgi:glycosyltransferase involved in cell wall biosynthesis